MLSPKLLETKQAAESSLVSFIRYVHPQRVLGHVHIELCSWWTRQDALSHQLVLLPRDHGKSAMVAYRVAWEITKNPTLRVLYISSTANLAIKQLSFIKEILTSDRYRALWPDMVHPEEGKRTKWTETEIAVDHPLRKKEAVRDPTIFTAGLTTGITGMHCDIAVLDDVVVRENAYTLEGRERVESQYSLLSSIEGADAKEWVVGTRYYPQDLYYKLQAMTVEKFDQSGNLVESFPLYETFEKQVESVGDGTGEFLWPRSQRSDGKWFGFNVEVLAKKKAQYLDKSQFRAQYYNDPNDETTADIKRDWFQYYDKTNLTQQGQLWYYGSRLLHICAAIDFAFSLSKRADFTSIVVVGTDEDLNHYVLDIRRFKTDKISEYFDNIFALHAKWGFREIKAEVTQAQAIIVNDLKENYIQRHGLALRVLDHKPHSSQGSKEERIRAALQHRYENGLMFHYRGGNCELLEEELVQQRPSHDDIKDALASAIEITKAPNRGMMSQIANKYKQFREINAHPRFGGIG